MKRFHFRLDPLLRLRAHREELARFRWAQALRAYHEKVESLREAERWIEESFRDEREALREGRSDLRFWSHSHAYRQSLDTLRTERLRQREERARIAEREQSLWIRSRRDLRVLEGLRERQRSAHHKDHQRLLQEGLDEIAILRAGAGR